MQVTDIRFDEKVKSYNIQFNIHIKDYCKIANEIIKNNPLQRNRISNSRTVYSLLKEDIINGCLIPPIVLASRTEIDTDAIRTINDETLKKHINQDIENIDILDGLQRTYTILEAFNEKPEIFEEKKYHIRAEIYLGITDTNILYRMLTLNTGQTPMTLRHQLEILFSHYIKKGIDGIKVIKQVDADIVTNSSEFNFSDLIDGYTSFMEGTELPIDRVDLLNIIKGIDFLSNNGEDGSFVNFTRSYYALTKSIEEVFEGITYPKSKEEREKIPEQYRIESNPFGTESFKIFNRSQALTGFGASLSHIKEIGDIEYLNVDNMKNMIIISENPEVDFQFLIKTLDDIRLASKKIGNGQRIFFKHFFRCLLQNFDNECYLNLNKSISRAKSRALSEI